MRSVLPLLTGCLIGTLPAAAERTPWTSSRLAGSPEPPLPFTVEKIFEAIKWENPIYALTDPGANRDHVVIVQQGGEENRPTRIFRVKADPSTTAKETFLELPGWLVYGMTFDPDYRNNHFVYLFQKGRLASLQNENGCRISRYRVQSDPIPRIDPESELTIIEWRSHGHDGGDLAFGQDGMLYITTGDGTADSDRWVSGQTLDDLLGAVLRLEVRQATPDQPYQVPHDNPFHDQPGARPEIWAYGLRNPWRITADVESGQIWVGNNGQDLWETAHLVRRGENYGRSVFEGSHPFYPNRKLGPTPHVLPTVEHPHSGFRSLTGGVV
jgi:glucose/arabinose dehydrogenase